MPSTSAKQSAVAHTSKPDTLEEEARDQEVKTVFGYKLSVCGTMRGVFGARAQPKNSCRAGKNPLNGAIPQLHLYRQYKRPWRARRYVHLSPSVQFSTEAYYPPRTSELKHTPGLCLGVFGHSQRAFTYVVSATLTTTPKEHREKAVPCPM